MAPATEQASHSGGPGTIALVVAIAVAAFLILAIIVVSIIPLVRKRRAAANRCRPVAVPPSVKGHKTNPSDCSTNALLVHGKYDPEEKWPSPEWSLPSAYNAVRDAPPRNNAKYHYLPGHPPAPSPVTLSTAPSHHPPYTHDIKAPRDYHHQIALANRPSHPPLPPLVIPSNRPLYSQGLNPTTVSEELYEEPSPTQPLSSCPSSASLYSQSTAEPSQNTPSDTFSPLQVPEEPRELPDNALKRGETRLVGNLLKARAKRNADSLIREASQVSRIERMGSIRSVGSPHEDDRPFPNRYRLKKQKARRTMDVVRELSVDTRSSRTRSGSSAYDELSSPFNVPIPDIPSPPPLLFMRVEPSNVTHGSSVVPLRIEPKRRIL